MSKLKHFCCICMQKSEIVLSLNSVDDNNVKFIKKLRFCSPQQTWKHTYQICHSCTSQLNQAYAFIHCCLESEKFRKEELTEKDEGLTGIAKEINKGKSCVNTREKKFTCDHCNKLFRQKKYLSQHITKLHINKKKKEETRRTVNKELEDIEVVPGVLKQESSSNDFKLEHENVAINKDEPIKEEKSTDNTNKLEIDNVAVEEDKVDIKNVKCDISDTEDFGETTDFGNNGTENYENYSADSEVDNESDKVDKSYSKKRGRKKKPQKCSFCDEVFSKRHEWATHIRTKHTFKKPFSCDLCDARYMNGYSLLIHKRKHNNEKPFICAACGKSFVSSADLNHHNKIHDADRAYPCPMCDRSFKTHSNLRTHRLQMHLDPAEWKFACHLCEKKFPIRGNLVKHLKRHAGIKEFNCHICDKRFVNKAELTLHLNTHTNQRLFKCMLCGKDYKNREGLRRHMKVVHDQGNWKAPKSDKKHLCPMCPKLFAFSNKLQRHIFTHTGEKPFKCDYCQKRFIDNYGRKVHYKKDHNVVNFHDL